MKPLIIRIFKKLRAKSGEMLIEAIVSIMLLTIMLTTITAMIAVSNRMTSNSMIQARTLQDETFNLIALGTHPDFDGALLEFSSEKFDTDDFKIPLNIEFLYDNPGIIAFFPVGD